MRYVRSSEWFFVPAVVIALLLVLWLSGQATSVLKQRVGASHAAGSLISDATTGLPAVAPMTMNFVRTPDSGGPDGRGRYLIGVNSGYGLMFNSKSKAQQTLSVIDLNRKPQPQVIQNLYFPAPQSANFGIVFDQRKQPDGKYLFYLAGGFENKVWIMSYDPGAAVPIAPANKPDELIKAPFIDVSAFASSAPSPAYNDERAAVYPTGLALTSDGQTLFAANNLGDSLGIVADLRDQRNIRRVPLRRNGSQQFTYPYDVKLSHDGQKVFVSLWGDATVAVVNPLRGTGPVRYIPVGRHPTAMLSNSSGTRLYVANSDADTVSEIDVAREQVTRTIDVKLNEVKLAGTSPEGLTLSTDEKTLYVANSHANTVAVVELTGERPKVKGAIPTGSYPSALAVVGGHLVVADGKGVGMDNSSLRVNETGFYPNLPNDNFPSRTNRRGMYSAAIVSGTFRWIAIPGEKQLFDYTQAVLQSNGLVGKAGRDIFHGGKSPFKHVVYIIRENRTYDQVFGDVTASGDGTKADGDPAVAIFGAGEAAKSPAGSPQSITPNAHAIVARFGLFDRFFVNAEASPDGHNWSTAAFSSDYIDKAFRWNYSGRGRTYDYEGFNRLPDTGSAGAPPVHLPSAFDLPATVMDLERFYKRYIPYLNGARDVGEPESLYLWDAAKRAGLTYRSYGEFVTTISRADLDAINTESGKKYPDLSPNISAFGVKPTLEGHVSPSYRNFDQDTPDAMTTDSYRAAKAGSTADPLISDANTVPQNRGTSRAGAWSSEFQKFVQDRQSGRGDNMPSLSIVRLSNDHTAGLSKGVPTPQFYVAENDYAVGRVVEAVSNSPYWADTAIFVVEDDAQDGPDHVDAHRSPALVISAYNKPGILIHEMHNTVSLIRTMEICLGISPMNFLDSAAVPMDIFREKADMTPFKASLPDVALDNLFPPEKPSAAVAYYFDLTRKQDLRHADMANPLAMNEIIWYSVRRDEEMPAIARFAGFDLLKSGMPNDTDDDESEAERASTQKPS